MSRLMINLFINYRSDVLSCSDPDGCVEGLYSGQANIAFVVSRRDDFKDISGRCIRTHVQYP